MIGHETAKRAPPCGQTPKRELLRRQTPKRAPLRRQTSRPTSLPYRMKRAGRGRLLPTLTLVQELELH